MTAHDRVCSVCLLEYASMQGRSVLHCTLAVCVCTSRHTRKSLGAGQRRVVAQHGEGGWSCPGTRIGNEACRQGKHGCHST